MRRWLYHRIIKTLKSPTTHKECQRLMGMLGWVRDFVLNFELVVEPIRAILRSTKRFQWTAQAEMHSDGVWNCWNLLSWRILD